MAVVEVRNIVKQFGKFIAVSDVSFSVDSGKIFGLLGPNGAGKTTTIRMMNNIIMPDSGSISILGEPMNFSLQNRIGYLPEERGLYKKLKVIEQIVYFARLKNLSEKEAIEKGRYWLDKLGAKGWEQKKIQELSKGMQQKVQFVTTIIHNPELYILDEPFSGLDPINTELLKNIIMELKSLGKTIILSTHVMEQVEQLCDEICLINKGSVILEGNVRDIKKQYGTDTFLVEYEGDSSVFQQLDDIKIANESRNRIEFRIINNASHRNIINFLNEKIDLHKFSITEPSLNEIFIESVGKSQQKQEIENV
jgi:ABC-2 type transport system ATP-binding protein